MFKKKTEAIKKMCSTGKTGEFPEEMLKLFYYCFFFGNIHIL